MTDKPKARIYDMQGTLVDVSAIRWMVEGQKKDFDAFHCATGGCPPHEWVLEALKADAAAGVKPIVLTGMTAKFERVVDFWLAYNEAPMPLVLMRANGDFRKDVIIKREFYERLIKFYDVIGAYDDNPAIVELWRELELPTVVVPGWGVAPKEGDDA